MTRPQLSSGHYDDLGIQTWPYAGFDVPDAGLTEATVSAAVAPAKPAASVLRNTLYLTEPGTSAPISVTDINQGQLGDCFLLASIGEIALFHPSKIQSMIRDNGNGTQSVTLYQGGNGRLPTWTTTSFKPVTVSVTDVFNYRSVNNGATQNVVGNQKEIWPQVLEAADATLHGGIGGIAYGGSPILAMEELTGKQANGISPASLTIASLLAHVSAGDLMVFDTAAGGALGYGLVNSHAYMFDHVTATGNGGYTVSLDNPWGNHQPAAIPFQNLARAGIVEIDIGHV